MNTHSFCRVARICRAIFCTLFFTAIIILPAAAQKGGLAPTAPTASADIDQCLNGPANAPLQCTGSAWANGSANENQAHWAESQFVAYRIRLTGLTPGPTVNTLTIGYDAKKGATHAIDYLGTFNATEGTANPCSGVSGCSLASPTSSILIPPDTVTVTSQINPNTNLPVVQLPGQFTLWGGTLLTAVYEPYAGGDERKITVTFTASVANPVIAWGGHIAWIGDWGAGNSANSIGGAPYHMRLDNLNGSGGNQDRGLQAAAVIPSGAVFIKKVANTLDGSGSWPVPFPFTSTSNFGTTAFSLIDDNAGPGLDTIQSQPITSFGPTNSITVTETASAVWTLANVNCVENVANDSTQNGLGPSAVAIVQAAEVVTCTFTNTQLGPSAAAVSIGGRVLTPDGAGISKAAVTLTYPDGTSRTAFSSSFGYYRFDEVESGETYVISVGSKRYQFNVRIITASDDLFDLDLIGF